MDGKRLDAFARAIVADRGRRSLLRTLAAGGIGLGLARRGQRLAAACGKTGDSCQGDNDCCKGARCRRGRCGCKPGWKKCDKSGHCRQLATDPDHCGECDVACPSREPCCQGGECRGECDGECCADCFAEAIDFDDPQIAGTEFCCPKKLLCHSGTGSPDDDVCCWPDEVCLNGSCCCDGCEGKVVCGGKCCPQASCCNDKCCGAGEVCAKKQPNKPKSCVSADRDCTTAADCFVDEQCLGVQPNAKKCCGGDRICGSLCCPYGYYCEAPNQCCFAGQTCNTSKHVRIRA